MKLEALRIEARQLLAKFAQEVRFSSAMGDTSISNASELFLLEVLRDLLRETMDLPALQNLNTEKRNFPGLDLGDKEKGVGFQVTADPSLGKILDALQKVIAADLHLTYPRVRIFVTTTRQQRYKQSRIDEVTDGKLQFDARNDVLDFKDLAEQLGAFELDPLQRVVDVLHKHLLPRGVPGCDQHVVEIQERDLARRYQKALQRSFFAESQANDEFSSLAEEVLTKLGARVSAALRRRVLLWASRSAVTKQRLEDAKRLLSAATNLAGPDSDLPARARILETQGDPDAAIRLLRDEHDADAVSNLVGVIARTEGDDAALAFVADQPLDTRQLTASGTVVLSQIYLRRADFDPLVSLLDSASEAQLSESPYLAFLRGMVRVVTVLPKSDRMMVLGGVPLNVSFARPILAPGELTAQLDAAIADLQYVLPIVRQLELPETARTVKSYLTWASLLHPYRRAAALAQLRADMREFSAAVYLVQFALHFDDTFDVRPLEEWLAKRESRGGLDDHEARAALVIQLHGNPPERVAEVIARHRARLQRVLGEPLVLIIEVQALALAKDTISARVQLDAGKHMLDASHLAHLEAAIATAEGADPVIEHLRVYDETRTIEALRALVRALKLKRDHRALGKYAEVLHETTGDPHDLAMAAQAYANAGDHEDFVRLIEAFPFLKETEASLKRRYGWQLVQLGRLREAKQIVEELRALRAGERDLDLEIALAVESGQWEMLSAPLTAYLSEQARYDGSTLIRAAHIAQSSDHGPVRELMEAALSKGGNEVEVLLGAYIVAVEAGLEDDHPQAQEWFRRALERSGPSGPIQQVELKELLDRQLEWNAHSRRIDEALIRGELPLIMAAPALNTTIVDLLLGNYTRNVELADPRKRSLIPLFSGRRAPAPVGEMKRVAFDITAVMTIGWLGLLPKVFDAFAEIVLPAGLLLELFEGRRRIRQFQRSRFVRAKQIRELIPERLRVVPESDALNDELVQQVGADLAALLRAAQTSDGIVVRPAPVLRVGLEDKAEVDLSAHAMHMTDMRGLLRVLVEQGAVDQATEELAQRFFALQDKGWPAPAVPDTARPLYLDDVAVSYLQTTGLLETVTRTFDEVYIASSVKENAVALADMERRSEEVLRTIDAIREAIVTADRANRILYGPRRASSEPDDLRDVSTMHLLADTLDAEAIVVDDRALNKERFATDGKSHQCRTTTSLDIIEELRARDLITDAQRLTLRTRLRRAGAALMAADAVEIRRAVQRSQLESVEFRAIRESVGLARIREAPRFPAEAPWFVGLNLAMKSAILEIWKHETDVERAAALSDVVLTTQPQPLEWAALSSQEGNESWMEAVIRMTTASLALPVELEDRGVREAYHRWLDSRVLEPMRSSAPARYRAVIEHVKTFVMSTATDDHG